MLCSLGFDVTFLHLHFLTGRQWLRDLWRWAHNRPSCNMSRWHTCSPHWPVLQVVITLTVCYILKIAFIFACLAVLFFFFFSLFSTCKVVLWDLTKGKCTVDHQVAQQKMMNVPFILSFTWLLHSSCKVNLAGCCLTLLLNCITLQTTAVLIVLVFGVRPLDMYHTHAGTNICFIGRS